MSYVCEHGVDLSDARCYKCEEPDDIKETKINNVYDEMVEKMEDHVFECYFFTQMIDPLEFTLHEQYYHIKNGKVIDLAFPELGDSKETPINVILHGKDLGVYDSEKKYERKFYDINIKQFKKNRKART
jgi:hypothetical protein